jgi:NAD(P)-dependent dehydrogenase (short-subunit alcohol dehydrogenase family)
MTELKDAVVLVTGGGGGIGRAVALRAAEGGARVAVTDVSAAAAEATRAGIEERGGVAIADVLDVTSAEAVDRVVDATERSLGPVTCAVACAGVIRTHPFLELPETSWDTTLAVNLKGTLLLFQSVARRLVAAGSPGALVAMSSVAGRGGRPTAVDYAVSKAGVISLVRSAALALAPHQVTVNAVCPGIVDTEMTRAIHADRARLSGITPEESLAEIARSIPLGRMETPLDVAEAVLFLLGPAGSYVTGQALNVCGGLEFD